MALPVDTGGNDASQPVQQVWKSGDFRKVGRSAPPYNGLEITADYTLDGSGGFDAITLTFTDYTKAEAGHSSTLDALRIGDGWVRVPKPADTQQPASSATIPPAAQNDGPLFTVHGDVMIAAESNGKVLRMRLTSGLPPGRQELGFIMDLSHPPAVA